ncbi:MAG: 3-beta hydroxysteroid dehydrogenase [Deltaproteobacteria bacterium]|nr:MAG: 3-beta hydroxysteroid dehydrogenase [Deltaproteobacteria bacterium]
MGTEKVIPLTFRSALVTGGSGFIGGAVVRLLLKYGIRVKVLARNPSPELEMLGVECCRGNLVEAETVCSAARGVDVVFHIAALAGIWGPYKVYYETNVTGTKNVVEACLKNQISVLVYTSTPSVVFNGRDIRGADESLDYAGKFLCHYARTKAMAEKIVLGAEKLKTCAIRPHLVWGPGDPHLLPRLIAAGRRAELKMVGEGDNRVDISYIDNVAHAHILAAKNLSETGTACGQAYFISDGEPVCLWDWINDLFRQMDIEPVSKKLSCRAAFTIGAILEGLYRLLRVKAEPRMTRFLAEQLAKSHYFSIEKARRELGYRPLVSAKTGLDRTLQWVKNEM